MMIVDAEFDVCIISIVRSFGDLPTTSSGCSWKYAVLKCNDQHQSPAGTTAHVADDLAGRPDTAFSEFRNPVAGLSTYLRCNGSSAHFLHIFLIFGSMRTQTTKRVRDSRRNILFLRMLYVSISPVVYHEYAI